MGLYNMNANTGGVLIAVGSALLFAVFLYAMFYGGEYRGERRMGHGPSRRNRDQINTSELVTRLARGGQGGGRHHISTRTR